MNLTRRAAAAFAVVFVVAVGSSIAVFSLARASGQDLVRYSSQVKALDAAMWGLRSDFYNYDDQMNMYVAVLVGDDKKDDLAETTYQQAVSARQDMGAELVEARTLNRRVAGPDAAEVERLLARLAADVAAYNGFADQARSAAQAGDEARALYLSTRGNLEPSNDIMPTLDKASELVNRTVTRELTKLQGRQARLQTVSVLSAALTAVLIAILAVGTRLLVIRRLVQLEQVMTRMSSGRAPRGSRVEVSGNDELAAVGRAFNELVASLETREEEVAAAARERQQQAELAFEHQRRAEQQVRDRAQGIIDETAGTVAGDLRELVRQVEMVRQAASTIESKVGSTDKVARTVVEQAARADKVVAQLQSSLREVDGMAQLIGSIADQTKLLALNATIEAARAGESGKGFAVVANEVKALASSTADSTQQIAQTISTLESHSQAVAQAIATMGEGITGVDDATGALRVVADEQFAVVATLTEQVGHTLERVESMSGLTERLERRAHRRVRVSGAVVISANGRELTGRLIDVSAGGLRAEMTGLSGLGQGQAVQGRFTVQGQEVTVAGQLVLHRAGATGNEIGLQFERPYPALERLLDQL